MFKKLIIVGFFILSFLKVNGEVFTVTSKNDSGIGSFREALTKTQTNGNSEIDYIYFNISGSTVSDHTIQLLTELPEITSDVVIDASTQTGETASVNGAKVVFDGTNFSHVFQKFQSFFKISSVNVFELYGLVIRNFDTFFIGNPTGLITAYFQGQNKDVKIGAPGKGNVFYNIVGFSGSLNDFNLKSSIVNFTIKNTIFGLKEDGVTIAAASGCGIQIFRLTNVIIGGDTKEEGNIFYGEFSSFIAAPGETQVTPFNMLIKNNIFYANKNEERPGVIGNTGNKGIGFSVDSDTNHPATSKIVVTDNIFGIGLYLGGFKNADILIARNSFGVSRDKTKLLPIFTQALSLRSISGKVLIGGPTTSEGNNFSYTNNYLNYERLFPGAVWSEKSSTVELSHNSFFCNPRMPFLYKDTGPFGKVIEVFLDDVTPTSIRGRSKPNARVELFYSDPECTNCQPKRYFATVTADQVGNWVYNGLIEQGYSILASATLNGISSEFSDPRVYMLSSGPKIFKVTPQTCDEPNGKIEGVFTVNVNKVEWVDEAGKVVGTSLDLINVPAGSYRIKAYQFGCIYYSDIVIVENNIPQLSYTGQPDIVQPSCGKAGSILNLHPNYFKDYYWTNELGEVISKNRELKNVTQGSYTLNIVGTTDCIKTFGPYILKNILGPNIDLTKINIEKTTCLSKTGNIKGILSSGIGNLKYTWTNENNTVVGNDIDLLNVGVGTYKIEITDESGCNPIQSPHYTIIEIDGVIMSEDLVELKNSSCNANTGSIKGITVKGATNYSWVDINGLEVSVNREIENIRPGIYTLKAFNNLGCIKFSKAYTIDLAKPAIYPIYNISIIDATCNLNNGSISVDFGNAIPPKSIKWINENNEFLGNSSILNHLGAGIYKLYFEDENGCEVLYRSIALKAINIMVLDEGALSIVPDICGQAIGSLSKISITGGKPPYIYTLQNSANQTVNFSNLLHGHYTLNVTDQLNCQPLFRDIIIPNGVNFLPPPIVDPIIICNFTTINITVQNKENVGFYKLYDSEIGATPILTNKNGNFQVTSSGSSKFFVSYSLGECESLRSKVIIEMNGAELSIPNSFSPNGDNINDYWTIKEINRYPKAIVRIYNRYGSKIFENIGSELKFDGKYEGKLLSQGTYYYSIMLSSNCKMISGPLTIVY